MQQYLYIYLRDMINDHKATMKLKNFKTQFGEWKTQLSMSINFVSSNDTGETRIIYVWSDHEEIMMGKKSDDIINELFASFLDNYQKEEKIMRGGSDFLKALNY